VTWHVGPSAAPADLGGRLLGHGLVHAEDEPGMAFALALFYTSGRISSMVRRNPSAVCPSGE